MLTTNLTLIHVNLVVDMVGLRWSSPPADRDARGDGGRWQQEVSSSPGGMSDEGIRGAQISGYGADLRQGVLKRCAHTYLAH